MPLSPRVIFQLAATKMVQVNDAHSPASRNFVIVCDRGNWSGFLTLEECKERFEGLEAMGRPPGYFWVEER